MANASLRHWRYEQDRAFREKVIEILREASRRGTPAMKARSRKLLLQLEAGEQERRIPG